MSLLRWTIAITLGIIGLALFMWVGVNIQAWMLCKLAGACC